MTLQAKAIGVDAHQFRVFDRDAVASEFGVPREWEVTSMTAFATSRLGSAERDNPVAESRHRNLSRRLSPVSAKRLPFRSARLWRRHGRVG